MSDDKKSVFDKKVLEFIENMKKEDLKKALDKYNKDLSKINKNTSRVPEHIGNCKVCGGKIMEILSPHYSKGQNFIGNQTITYHPTGSFCESCGLMYKLNIVKANGDV